MRRYRGIRFASDTDLDNAYKLAAHAYHENTEVQDDLKDALVYLNGYTKANPGNTEAKKALERVKSSLASAQKLMVDLTYAVSQLKKA